MTRQRVLNCCSFSFLCPKTPQKTEYENYPTTFVNTSPKLKTDHQNQRIIDEVDRMIAADIRNTRAINYKLPELSSIHGTSHFRSALSKLNKPLWTESP